MKIFTSAVLVAWFLLLGTTGLYAQNTVGLLSYDLEKAFDGYNLIYPFGQPNVYLLNNCGQIVHQWDGNEDFRPGKTAYLREDGSIVITKEHKSHQGDTIWAPGSGAIIEIRDWDNNLLWDFELNNSEFRLHHDIALMPNGNILAVAWHRKSFQEAFEWGRDTSNLTDDALYSEAIFEIDPEKNEIVWEWYAWDHMIQNFDSTKPNFGLVSEHPELINLNYDTRGGKASWLHFNSIDYSEELDQIILSVPGFNEIWVLDHSVSTEEASGHVGGRIGVGGDIAYRWGNPHAYDRGTASEQKLFFQHDVAWVDDFVDGAFEHYGKIEFFNNRIGPDYSAGQLLRSPFDMYDWIYPKTNMVWGPPDYDLTVTHPDTTALYSNILSSVQLLPNNNWLICSGRSGYSFELDSEGALIWEYRTPFKAGLPVSQGDSLQVNDNFTFRMDRYPVDFVAFEGKDLSPKGYIEQNPNESFCTISSIAQTADQTGFQIFPNPSNDWIHVNHPQTLIRSVELFDALGNRYLQIAPNSTQSGIDIGALGNGIYLLRINKRYVYKIIKH